MKNLESPTFKGQFEEEASMNTTEQKKLERNQENLESVLLWRLKQAMGCGNGGGRIKGNAH